MVLLNGWLNIGVSGYSKTSPASPQSETQPSSSEVREQALWAEAGKLISFSLFKLKKMASA